MAALWSTQMVLILAVGFDLLGDRPLSYLALEADVGFLFGVGLTVSAVLFVTFQRHLRHRYRLGVAFSVTMLVGMAGQFLAGVVPIGGTGTASRVHVAAALTLGASIPVLMWRFAADQPSGAWRRWCYGLFWLEVAACAAGIALSRNQVAPLAEILPALAFHAWVATVTFGPGHGDSGRVPDPALPAGPIVPGVDQEFADRFVEEWVAAWNAHDLERILSHYADDVTFSSPHIVNRLGKPTGEVTGKAELRQYWGTGLEGESDLHFTIEDIRYSVDTIVINYRNQRDRAVAEVLRIRDGLVFWGCGAYEEAP